MEIKDYKSVALNLICPDPEQPRKVFVDSELSELKGSIAEQGILTPLVIESNYNGDKYLLLDGERRYRCSNDLNLKEVPAQIIEGPLTYEERTIIRFHIQEQMKNWSELDKARAIYKYKIESNKTITEIAKELNLHIPKVHAYLSITEFTTAGNKLIAMHNIDFTYLIYLIRVVKDYLAFSGMAQEQIEEKLINKVISNKFKNASEFQLFSKLMNEKGHENEKLEFLKSLDMTFTVFKEKAYINKVDDSIKFVNLLKKFNTSLEEISAKKETLGKEHYRLFDVIKVKLNNITENEVEE